MTLTELKDELLTAISAAVADKDLESVFNFSQAYSTLCHTEAICRCPVHEEDETLSEGRFEQ